MPLVIADQDREILEGNRLKVVVAQAKFPPIYSVNTPAGIAAFQASIQESYPIAEDRATVMRVRIGPSGVGAEAPEPGPWRFRSEDGSWIVALSQDSVSLETSTFRDYDDFHAHAAALFRALVDVFGPARLDRIGLRFVNEISFPDMRGLPDWQPLLGRDLLGVLAEGDLLGSVSFALQQINLDLDGGKLIFKHGFVARPDATSDASLYLVDIDAYDDTPAPFEPEALLERMIRYNTWAWNLFRANVSGTLVERLRAEGAAR